MEAHRLPPHVHKAVRAIQNCRTAALGAHTDVCDECGYMKISYNSCRNRHCPKCQGLAKERWVMEREAELLPLPYFHVVFTLPDESNSLVMNNQTVLYNLLFKAAAETLREISESPKYLNAQPGFISILHTWGQTLTLHPHVHMIVPGGGLTTDGRFVYSKKKFFVPVKVLSKKFRGKFLYYLKKAKQELILKEYADERVWEELIDLLYRKSWYVYCKRPFKTSRSVLEYLGRYTHRVAISNQRLVQVENGSVSFKWRDYRDGSKEKVMTLSAHEFIRRFLLHILPPGFTKIRHYGFLASAVKAIKLALCKRLTGATISQRVKLTTAQLILRLTGCDITVCPCCGADNFRNLSGLSPPLA